MRYLILGRGPAGIAAARAARKKDPDAEVVIVTEECTPPCLRPHLPDLVSGEKEEAAIADPQGKDLASAGIRIAQGKRARPDQGPGAALRRGAGVRTRLPRARDGPGAAQAGAAGDLGEPRPPAFREPDFGRDGGEGDRDAPEQRGDRQGRDRDR